MKCTERSDALADEAGALSHPDRAGALHVDSKLDPKEAGLESPRAEEGEGARRHALPARGWSDDEPDLTLAPIGVDPDDACEPQEGRAARFAHGKAREHSLLPASQVALDPRAGEVLRGRNGHVGESGDVRVARDRVHVGLVVQRERLQADEPVIERRRGWLQA